MKFAELEPKLYFKQFRFDALDLILFQMNHKFLFENADFDWSLAYSVVKQRRHR